MAPVVDVGGYCPPKLSGDILFQECFHNKPMVRGRDLGPQIAGEVIYSYDNISSASLGYGIKRANEVNSDHIHRLQLYDWSQCGGGSQRAQTLACIAGLTPVTDISKPARSVISSDDVPRYHS